MNTGVIVHVHISRCLCTNKLGRVLKKLHENPRWLCKKMFQWPLSFWGPLLDWSAQTLLSSHWSRLDRTNLRKCPLPIVLCLEGLPQLPRYIWPLVLAVSTTLWLFYFCNSHNIKMDEWGLSISNLKPKNTKIIFILNSWSINPTTLLYLVLTRIWII